MKVNWRLIHAARNSFATLSAACEQKGFILNPAEESEEEVTCYSLNSINEPMYRYEIANAACRTIVGRPHATASPREVAEYADFVIAGEGEYTLPRLLAHLEEGGSGHIPGVTTRDYHEPADTGVQLDAFPAFGEHKGYVEISRGCPFSCGYCQTPQIFGQCMRHRSINSIVKFANRYGHARFVTPNAFAYGSDGVHPRWDKLEHLLRGLDHKIYLGTFPSEVRPEFICEASLPLLTRYCSNTKLHFGAQSGSNGVLGRLRRGHTVEDVVGVIDLCRDYALTPVVDFIVGLTFETGADQRDTLDLIRWVARYGKVHLHRFIPLPGTPLAGHDARPLLKETEKIRGELALTGKLTGSWNDPAVRFFRRRLK